MCFNKCLKHRKKSSLQAWLYIFISNLRFFPVYNLWFVIWVVNNDHTYLNFCSFHILIYVLSTGTLLTCLSDKGNSNKIINIHTWNETVWEPTTISAYFDSETIKWLSGAIIFYFTLYWTVLNTFMLFSEFFSETIQSKCFQGQIWSIPEYISINIYCVMHALIKAKSFAQWHVLSWTWSIVSFLLACIAFELQWSIFVWKEFKRLYGSLCICHFFSTHKITPFSHVNLRNETITIYTRV